MPMNDHNMQQNKEKKKTHRRVKTQTAAQNFRIRRKITQSVKNHSPQRNIIENVQSFFQYEGSPKIQKSPRAQKSPKSIHQSRCQQYNKWYIKPSIRLKKSLLNDMKLSIEDFQFAYNKLYEQKTLREDLPFLAVNNQKLELLQKIPLHNLRLLDGFKRNQQSMKKRVPKIVDMFLKKKTCINQVDE